ncbi:jg22765, partial [Pararge aegeria aegeria]
FGIRDVWEYLIGGGIGYGQYPGQYGGYPGGYPGQYPGQYPYRPDGPPGAHPGCPLCDSSVYSYCSHKEAHDSCCCDNSGYHAFTCRRTDCKFLYANSCQEYHLITSCCCVDLQKSAVAPIAPIASIVAPVIAA